jgi:hypothetical protein
VRSARYWIPSVLALVCFYAATRTSAIVGFVLIIVAFGLVIEVSTKLFEQAGKTGNLTDHRQ